jgi:hypothetical protein
MNRITLDGIAVVRLNAVGAVPPLPEQNSGFPR